MSALHSLGTLKSTQGTFCTLGKELGAAVLIDTTMQLHSVRQAVPGQDLLVLLKFVSSEALLVNVNQWETEGSSKMNKGPANAEREEECENGRNSYVSPVI